MSTDVTPTPEQAMDAIRRLAALRLLDERMVRLSLELKGTQKEWSDMLSEKTKELHQVIEEPNPGKLQECKDRLNLIRSIYDERRVMVDDKKNEIDAIKAKINRTESALSELIRQDPEDLQQELELEDKAGPDLAMTADTARAVGDAIRSLVKEGAEITPDVEDLKNQLDEMGMGGLRLVDESEEEADEAEDEDE